MKLAERLKWDKDGLVPVAVADCRSKRTLVLCFMNKEALRLTLETGRIHTYSRSRARVALKGESSGHFQQVSRIMVNCNEDSLLFEVEQNVAACHAGYFSCYYREYDPETQELRVVEERLFDPEQAYKK